MSYKILEQNGTDNENIDGAAFNNFCAGGRDGIIKEVLDECAVFKASENTVCISPGELLIHGVRIKITELIPFTLSSVPVNPIRYQIIADLVLTIERKIEFNTICRVLQAGLVQEDLYKTESGHYQVEIARFTHSSTNDIEDIVRTLDIITGGTSDNGGGAKINIGSVTTHTLAPGLEAEVDVEPRYDEEQNEWVTDFQFSIPKGATGEILTIDTELSADSENPVQNKVIVSALSKKADKTYVDDAVSVLTQEQVDSLF